MDIARFFADYGIVILLIGLLVFMFYSSRRRMRVRRGTRCVRNDVQPCCDRLQ